MNRYICLATASAIAMATGATAPAFAQSAGPAVLEEIVVTANKREESVQRVPISVSAISAQSAQARGVVDLQSIATAVPGLTTSRSAGSNSPYIRGVGNPAPEIANEPSVATYVDGVYIPYGGATLFDLNNIERVEVLKGPQGTLFGRNATGGVIHVLTRDPTHQPSADISVGYANYKTWSGKFYGTVGLSDDLAANVALSMQERDKGWGTNVNTGNDTSTPSSYIARGKLLWTPGTDTRVLLSAAFDRVQGNPGFSRTPLPDAVVANPPGPAVGNVGFYNTNLTFDPRHKQNSKTFSAKVDQDLQFATLTSITAYSKYRLDTYYDLDVSPAVTTATDLLGYNEMWTQELQLKSSADSPVQWIVGGFYFNGTAGYDPQNAYVGTTTTRSNYTDINTESLAAFGQATVEIFADTHLTAGARYTRDHRQILGLTAINGVIQTPTITRASTSWKKATWRLALDHQVTEDAMVYASVNTGFKSGVYNPTSFTNPPANPETLTAYEAGFKTQWLDNRLRLNGSAYWYDYKNMQVTVIVTPAGSTIPTSFTQNAAKARVKGIDLELQAVPTDRLTINAGLSAMDAEYTSYPNGNHFSPRPQPSTVATGGCANLPYLPTAPGGQVTVVGCDLSGNDMIQAPKFTFNASGNYRIPTEVGDFNLNLTYFRTAKWFFEPDNSVGNKSYDLVNASIGWTAADGRWGASLWGRNLTKTKYYLSGASTSAGRYYAAAEPRTYGVTLTAHLQ